MKKIFLAAAVMAATSLWARVSLDQKIGQMLMIGFHGTSAPQNSQICKDIGKYHIGAVILFDYNPVDKSKAKNIASKQQLSRLTAELQKCSYDRKLLIAVDQEGGKVQRLKSRYGFYGHFPKASEVKYLHQKQIKKTYVKMAKELKSVGINFDLAPVVDLDINPKNHVIHGLGRSFGKNPKKVAAYAGTFIDAMHQYGVLTSLKHFPGHGSSMGDTHKGFVDVTHLWKRSELEPYRLLNKKADTVMVAHVFNKRLDPKYPASLSEKTVDGLLRKQLGFHGVVITDDMQMGAISKKYSLKQRLKLAVNAGDDMLIFGNQLDPRHTVSSAILVETVKSLVENGEIRERRIDNAYRRIQKLKNKL
ncbi:glycoside hydrolase family 3 N-terminal domain-containing protein [Sulfurovum sp.]|uniref:glycoside hydrolase family 3 N-terminal domain-containing protein n=1 Tax=Sulfurovum sp. TaxID=1969726 RepID=UPI0025E157A8|nr:glycoside hydrolase family 3 N-terminal domain-containing protein [Sulfurovum sp.]